MHRETVYLLGRFGVSSEKSPFSADLPKVDRSSTERPGSKQGRVSEMTDRVSEMTG
jgi:hypothetical protein